MEYKEKLQQLIFDENENAFFDWLEIQPLTEQVVILKEFKKLSLQTMFKNQDFKIADTIKEFAKFIDQYEKAVLAEIEAEKNYEKVIKEQEENSQKIDELTLGVKKYVLDCIVNNEPNAKQMKELAFKIIGLEKEQGIHDANFWKEIL